MAHHLRTDLDQLLPQRRQRPVFHGSRQRQPTQEVAEVVRQGEQLQSHLVIHEVVARELGPLDRVLALLDPLLRRAALVVESHDPLVAPGEIRDDETDAGE